MLNPVREFNHRENLLTCLQALTPNQRYSYLQQANYAERTGQILIRGNGGSCLDTASFFAHDDLIRCMLDVPTAEQRYELLSTPSASGEYPIIQIARLPFETQKMLVVLEHVLSIVTDELRYKLLQLQDVRDQYTSLHHVNHPDTVKCIFSFITDDQTIDLMQIEDRNGMRPLDLAMFFNRHLVVEAFIENLQPQHRSILLGKNSSGLTALHYLTCGYKNSVEVVKCLLGSVPPKRRVELLTVEDNEGKTAIDIVKQENERDLLQLLIAYKCNAELELKELQSAEGQT